MEFTDEQLEQVSGGELIVALALTTASLYAAIAGDIVLGSAVIGAGATRCSCWN